MPQLRWKTGILVLVTGITLAYTNCSAPTSKVSETPTLGSTLPSPTPSPSPAPTPTPTPSDDCDPTQRVGFKEFNLPNGLPVKIWYPTSSQEFIHSYSNNIAGSVALNGTFFSCEKSPVLIFSHGTNGCSTQSVTFTEELARKGYVVIAPDHYDSTCVLRRPPEGQVTAQFSQPQDWSEQTYKDRYQDSKDVLDYLQATNEWASVIDIQRVGMAGHSLGGYTAAGLGGAWSTWRDNRIKAVLGLSPYVEAYLYNNTIPGLQVPIMYQGGVLDTGITPTLTREDGAYNLSPSPKYLIVLKRANHFEWTNTACGSLATVAECLAEIENLRLINEYGFAFLEKYVRGSGDQPILRMPNSALQDLRYQE